MIRLNTLSLLLFLTIIVPNASFATVKDNFLAYYGQGVRFFNSGEYTKSITWLEAAMHCDNADMKKGAEMLNLARHCRSHMDTATILYTDSKYMEAYYHYDIVAQNNSNDMKCRLQMGSCITKHYSKFSDMVLVEGGHFMMGSKSGNYDEQPVHLVKLGSFYMDAYEVSNAQYARFLNIKGLYCKEGFSRIDFDNPNCMLDTVKGYCMVKPGAENLPVVGVNWYGANDYAIWVGKQLPTEAQFEYAFGDSETSVNGGLHDVDSGKPNQFGIYNLSGNVWEWCQDWYFENTYQLSNKSNNVDPVPYQPSEYKSMRGGAFNTAGDVNVKTRRNFEAPALHYSNVGFRCVYNVPAR